MRTPSLRPRRAHRRRTGGSGAARPVGRGAVVAVAAVLLAACTASPADEGPAGAPAADGSERGGGGARFERYVALGDSFTAGPFVPTTDLASGCFRSDGNYPSLLAEALEVDELVDVSCSGARSDHLHRRQLTLAEARVPPQLDALDEDTDLVTLGVGGNDYDLYRQLTEVCLGLRDSDATGSPCRAALAERELSPTEVVSRIGRNVERAIGRVRERAPQARVVLVGYPRIAPTRGACPDRLPFADGDLPFADEVQRALNDALRRAADQAGAGFVDMYAASRGHDVCARAPYVQGGRTDRSRALAFHPLPRGMRAVARELEALLAA